MYGESDDGSLGRIFIKLVLDGAAQAFVLEWTNNIKAGNGFNMAASASIPVHLAPDAEWWQWLHIDLRGCDALAVELIRSGLQCFKLPFSDPAVRALLALPRGTGYEPMPIHVRLRSRRGWPVI